jgi:YidC/Oxa1 family membrane protein insertase
MNDQKNMILAIVLSAMVLIGWQFFFNIPTMEKRKLEEQGQVTKTQPTQPAQPGGSSSLPTPQPGAATPSQIPGQIAAPQSLTRPAAIGASPRVRIDTPSVTGSINLRGGRIDDVALVKYRETVDPKSPAIILLSPSGAPDAYYAEFGWIAATGSNVKVPDANTAWQQQGSGALTTASPVTLAWDNGEGLTFRRTISIDSNYLFTIRDEVENKGAATVSLFPYALISRHGTPQVAGFYILHEGPVGVMGDKGLQEFSYGNLDDKKRIAFDNVTNAWFGITDKYWAATLLPKPDAKLQATFSSRPEGTIKVYQTDYLLDQQTIAPGATGVADGRLFAGAKETALIDAYDKDLQLNRFELLIDWGWFYFITKPMFWAIDWFFRMVGNFGVAILLVTVLIKLIFFPLANKSYASMAKMKVVQPEIMKLRERFPDDKVKQQQEMMELYRREKINPIAGCLPILIQIPVFFALYKVLFVTIEMRHAPFFGWIRDLSAPDPTNLFNLFGLLPFDPSHLPVLGPFLVLGIWPIIMGITMWFQMKLNPAPPDPTQKMIFDWMPLIFTFMLASFPAGLVIYWAWNNTLSVAQQSMIMKMNGAKIELFDNIKGMFAKKKTEP